jgi:hypothetical protein
MFFKHKNIKRNSLLEWATIKFVTSKIGCTPQDPYRTSMIASKSWNGKIKDFALANEILK